MLEKFLAWFGWIKDAVIKEVKKKRHYIFQKKYILKQTKQKKR